MLNYYKVTTFFYEDNLIGQGTIERDFEFTNIYRYNIKSIRNTTDKIARIMSIVSSVEKKIGLRGDIFAKSGFVRAWPQKW